MSASVTKRYCIDANVLIQAWQKYYSPKFCTDYWKILSDLGKQGIIFIPQTVSEEIIKTDDDLATWLKQSGIPVHEIDSVVTKCLQDIYAKDPVHKYLVDNTKQRSLADPWVIAHAIKANACVVTKENKELASTTRIKIPNVCDNMGVLWIDDFKFIEELKLRFSCHL